MEIERIVLDTIDSTNSFAKREGAFFPKDKLVVISAEEQTGGRGRFERPWHSPRSKNLLATLSLFLPTQTLDLSKIAQFLSLVVFDLLVELEFHPLIKWPNDLLLNRKKVAGVLVELQEVGDLYQVVLGVGLNVNVDVKWLATLDQPATSLFVESHRTWDIEMLILELARHFLGKLPLFLEKGFAPFQKRFTLAQG